MGIEETTPPTSEWMASSIGTNPVVVRNVVGQLRRAGLVTTSPGVAGTRPARALSAISLLDVYRAAEVDGDLFAIHPQPNPNCPIGANIQDALEGVFDEAQRALETRLGQTSVADVLEGIRAASC